MSADRKDPPPLDATKRQRYANTVLELGGSPLVVDLRRPISAARANEVRRTAGGAELTVVTAENPRGQVRSAEENAAATASLRRALEAGGYRFVPCTGRDPEDTHRESGFAVAGSLGPALALARSFGQDAVFRFEDGAFLLVELAGARHRLPLPRP